MKKLITLSISLIIAFVLNAQLTESGNGFMELFDYEDGTVLDDVTYEGLTVEWPVATTTEVQNGMLMWDQEAGEVSFGFFEVAAALDLSGDNSMLSFKYQVPAEAVINLWFMDEAFGEAWFELPIVAGTDELQKITVDLYDAESISENAYDLSTIIEFYILPELATAGVCYLDDVMLGDASITTSLSTVSANSLTIYPNPATTEVSIGINANIVSIYNAVGQEVFTTKDYTKGTQINVENFTNGVYFIKADNQVQKLVIK